MCGFVGFWGGNWSAGSGAMAALVHSMAGCIAHRGPDRSDHWLDEGHHLALAHNRLAIVDLTPAGNQPMRSPSGRYVIIYNGEIYNSDALRALMREAGTEPAWRGHSDTETLLAAIDAWGLQGALERATGMFAFALWDKDRAELILGRDRLGEKPLYYGWQGGGRDAAFLFGSELKALAGHPAFRGEIDRDALSLYMRHNYVPAPFTIYRGLAKLPPGCFATLGEGAREPVLTRYWCAATIAEDGVANPFGGGREEAVEALESLLLKAVGQQMMADVPLGAFLSGGIDSSTIVALMQRQSSRPVKTFSIGFHESGYNEAEHALAVARHIGTDHTELYVTADQSMAVIPMLSAIYDEPFADPSQIPTFLVSQLARQQVTVALSGDAGDELFGGYNRYDLTKRFWGRISAVPQPLRRIAASGLTSLSPRTWNTVADAMGNLMPRGARLALLGDKIHKGAAVLASASVTDLYRGMISSWRDPGQVVIGGTEPETLLTGNMPPLHGLDDIQKMMALDMMTYLPDDILTKVDRAAMAVSLETRVPFLDHEVVEFAWRLPQDFKLHDGQTKWVLRRVLDRHVPRALIERPKMGFGVPIGDWLRGPLHGWAEELLSESRLRSEGFFNPAPIRQMWAAHQSGSVNMQYPLWIVLMFQSWLEAQSSVVAEAMDMRRRSSL